MAYTKLKVTATDTKIVPFTAERVTEIEARIKLDEAEAPKQEAMSKIRELEGEITSRRIREAYTDSTWMKEQEAKIATERGKL